jgi:hypothetical protein
VTSQVSTVPAMSDVARTSRSQLVQHGSTATGADESALLCTGEDADQRLWTRVDVLPADGMQEVWGSNPHSSTPSSG